MKAQVYPWRNRGFVYLAVPKAACSSVKWALREARQLPLPVPEWDIHGAAWPESMRFDRVRENIAEGLHGFTVVRHPVSRLASCFISKLHPDRIGDLVTHPEIRLGMTFEEFVDAVCGIPDEIANEHLASQSHLLSDHSGIIPVQIHKIESLAEAWPTIAIQFNLPVLTRMNSNGNYQVKTRQSVVDKINKRYKADLKAFGY